jgi:EpsD family peptidyl-prolyl cis-trans isomerase
MLLKSVRCLMAAWLACCLLPAWSADADWGVIPIDQETAISFGATDITKNFTDQYAFTLGGGTEAAYQVVASFDACTTGCGNAALSYGIYDANGGLVSDSGSAVLSSGNYVLQVKGTGMGSGNSASYNGAITFFASSISELSLVSTVPEPADWLLLACGLALVGFGVRRRTAGRGMKRPSILTLAICLGLSGCGPKSLDGTQVIARVDGDEISVHQLELALNRARSASPAGADREPLIDKLIDRQLAYRQAVEQKLDRRPEIMLRLEEARRDVLAAAYAEEVAARHQSKDEQAAATFYARHPALFAERKVYRLREISLPREAAALAELKSRLERKEDFDQVLDWLRRQPGNFGDQLVLRPAEQLPIEVAEQLARVQPGQAITFSFPRGLVAYQLQSAQAAPMNWSAAQPIIREHLRRQHESEWVRQELDRLRSRASIERQQAPG